MKDPFPDHNLIGLLVETSFSGIVPCSTLRHEASFLCDIHNFSFQRGQIGWDSWVVFVANHQHLLPKVIHDGITKLMPELLNHYEKDAVPAVRDGSAASGTDKEKQAHKVSRSK